MMLGMVSSSQATRTRKRPEERRAEILAEAARIALAEGLEKITLRAVADRLGVRPGLISHYFPAAEDLVIAALALAIGEERAHLYGGEGSSLQRIAALVARVEGGRESGLDRLWLNARHLCRFLPALRDVLEEQEALDRDQLMAIIADGVAAGEFVQVDPFSATVEILIAIDGVGAYANNDQPFEHVSFTRYVRTAAERALGLERGSLDQEIDARTRARALESPSDAR